jgi:histone deacetylase 1/2
MNEYYEYFAPTYVLDVPSTNMEDLNTRDYLDKVRAQVFDNIRQTAGGPAPSVQMQRE